MSDVRIGFYDRIRARFATLRWRTQASWTRLLRAWRYATQTLTADDAQSIILDCEAPAGWHALLTLTDADVLAQARARFADHPKLAILAAEACVHVARKWENHNDELHHAQCWAIELLESYATVFNIALVPLRPSRFDADEEVET